ncbi:uncharacterized protein LOC128385566 isoform X2 [Panonychus citri]|uniref:uncharacterized protein LOC128385566 isoform X2 n=1 Tax=Panonychus citri TaxID=50023 RepID=UPI0023071BDD|nr:uncharacterized protein LOC128385566 isoform X2 [Panonychus citri]
MLIKNRFRLPRATTKPTSSSTPTTATTTTTVTSTTGKSSVSKHDEEYQPSSSSSSSSSSSGVAGSSGGPSINWGKCPQLEPTNEEKIKKAAVITKCLESTPVPVNITRETVELHREQVAACALRMEGWFNGQGLYRFDKAENEIKAKKLIGEVEEKVLSFHRQCKEEAEDKYPVSSNQLIAQIQLYQACMDYFISEVCGIEVQIPGAEGSSLSGSSE